MGLIIERVLPSCKETVVKGRQPSQTAADEDAQPGQIAKDR
jgi:hypothetical protein